MNVPTEDREWEHLANRLRANNYTSTHIANEIGIAGKVWMLVNKKKKRQWLSRGFPDYCIILKRWSLLFVELKRQRKKLKSGKLGASPSRITEEQKDWVQQLNEVANVEAHIAYGAEHAIEIIDFLENK